MSVSAPTSVETIVLAAFAGDALSLGAHWEYDTDRIAKHFGGPVTAPATPMASYHAGKHAGDLTHIGDNALLLLRSVAEEDDARFHLDHYLTRWQAVWDVETPPAYLDHASKDLLAGLKANKSPAERASTDDDLAHSTKFFPLLTAYSDDEEALVKATRELVSTFQRGSNEAITAEWLARTAFRVRTQRAKPTIVLEAVATQLQNAWLSAHIAKGKATAAQVDLSDRDALRSYGEKKQFGERTVYTGLSCGTQYGVPALVHHLFRYEDAADWSDALVADASIGGNSNARCIALATLLAAYRGVPNSSKIAKWIIAVKKQDEIIALIQQIEKKSAK